MCILSLRLRRRFRQIVDGMRPIFLRWIRKTLASPVVSSPFGVVKECMVRRADGHLSSKIVPMIGAEFLQVLREKSW